MKQPILLVLLLLGGCGPYEQARSGLVTQARRGLELCQSAQSERQQVVEKYHLIQRQRVDDAFDADVRGRGELSADWVVEHRKAYALMLEQLYLQQSAGREADDTFRANLQAIDAALRQLQELDSLPQRLLDAAKGGKP